MSHFSALDTDVDLDELSATGANKRPCTAGNSDPRLSSEHMDSQHEQLVPMGPEDSGANAPAPSKRSKEHQPTSRLAWINVKPDLD